ncbi:MAG: hypothetical protein KY053_00305 [Candidatus Liptonbacteria bacterium]|nr:hypothetical protein [Candidatus Liptonbacteria bacterium]
MTVIQPSRKKTFLDTLILFFGGGVLVGLAVSVFFYAYSVTYRHEINSLGNKIADLKLSNAELNNNLFGLTDIKNLEILAQEKGLIKDKNPQWEFASR